MREQWEHDRVQFVKHQVSELVLALLSFFTYEEQRTFFVILIQSKSLQENRIIVNKINSYRDY